MNIVVFIGLRRMVMSNHYKIIDIVLLSRLDKLVIISRKTCFIVFLDIKVQTETTSENFYCLLWQSHSSGLQHCFKREI